MTHDYKTVEALASRLCHDAGGNWEAKRTKKNVWRAKAIAALDAYAAQNKRIIKFAQNMGLSV